eukprot:4445876-Pyramimonas_sp.AAC.2
MDESDAGRAGILSLHVTNPSVPITARAHSTPQDARVHCRDGPIGRGPRGDTLTPDQSERKQRGNAPAGR